MKLARMLKVGIGPVVALTVVGLLVAQPAPAPGVTPPKDKAYGTFHMRSNICNYKILDGEGKVTMKFRGTVMVNRLTDLKDSKKAGTIVFTSGKARKEYEGHDRVAYTGEGVVEITGKWRGLQFFGTGLDMTWYGYGVLRGSGEFDKNMDTGRYWYDNPEQFEYLPNTTLITVPNPRVYYGANPTVKGQGKQGGVAVGG